ncbi:aromatic amino acid aminotransferase [Bacillus sp. A053]|uniref:Aminotransferase n=1 Tax=Bacillus stercoris TaxID=2054641 RepID=A0ABU0V9P3_9BACI|nr:MULTISPECIES: aminotransferase [Bacillus]AUS11263.1 pyridoxal phosphate-dependent aminotransferase [Bacillus subtilis]POO78213.1 aromatic amino acid aminotransferase [Bacillus sp. MBGLi97]AFI29684.1 YugH [Bacillus sp. JS]ASB62216.1 pyridoxal phosphate-dependent aminotransferase [Bacillus sp. MD-5]AUZ40137.1 aromatic amino acid aminotransferase [Bacillus sp. MBGLi79]
MTSYLSDYVQQIKPSGIRKFFDLAATMEGVISLGVGEPDFVTAWNVREASILSLEQGYTSYTANAGLYSLREEISRYLSNRFDLSYSPDNELIVTVGASQALDIAIRALVNPGEEVIIPEPCFVAYDALVSLAGGIPVHVHTTADKGFKATAADFEAAVTEKTKAILICSPSNPTGSVYSKEELNAIAEFAKKHDVIVLADEIYAELTYDEEFTSIAALPGMKERTVVISGFSKAFAMTGWRLGFAAAPSMLRDAMLKIHQYAMMCAPAMAQFAALEGLKNGMEDVEKMKKSYRRRRNLFVESLNEIGLSCHHPGGAFYAFPSIKSTGMSSEQFAEELLTQEKVAVVPGSVFGPSGEGYIRCSYATSIEQLQEALVRMKRFLHKTT